MKEGLLIDRVEDYWKGQKFAGMPVNYTTTLGEDRLIAAWYCFKVLKNPVLHINSGTFFTIDIIDQDGLQGGYIIPGLGLQLEALNRGEKLSIESIETDKTVLNLSDVPHSTEQALQGIFVAYAHFIQKLTQRFNLSSLIINGGTGEKALELLKPLLPGLEISFRKDLNHHALYEWYRRNICL